MEIDHAIIFFTGALTMWSFIKIFYNVKSKSKNKL
jgi:hypothetical protein